MVTEAVGGVVDMLAAIIGSLVEASVIVPLMPPVFGEDGLSPLQDRIPAHKRMAKMAQNDFISVPPAYQKFFNYNKYPWRTNTNPEMLLDLN